jgi:hypothetical protein
MQENKYSQMRYETKQSANESWPEGIIAVSQKKGLSFSREVPAL